MADVYHSDTVITDPESAEAVQVPDFELPFEESFTATDEFILDPEHDLAVQVGDFTPHNAFDALKKGTPEEQFAAEAKPAKAKAAPKKEDTKKD
jgi:hypothetical protein